MWINELGDCRHECGQLAGNLEMRSTCVVPAFWSFNYFTDRFEQFDLEAANSSIELTNYLMTYLVDAQDGAHAASIIRREVHMHRL